MKKIALSLLLAGLVGSPAMSVVVLSDDFEAAPANTLNYTGFANWTVEGKVDVVAPSNSFGITGLTSKVVDLDGTPGPGTLVSKQSYALAPGDFVSFSFDLSGNRRGGAPDFPFAQFRFDDNFALTDFAVFGLGYNGIIFAGDWTLADVFTINSVDLLAADAPWQRVTASFTARQAGFVQVAIGTTSNDRIGPLLDNVELSISAAIPEPATWGLMIAGFGLVGAAARRRRPALA